MATNRRTVVTGVTFRGPVRVKGDDAEATFTDGVLKLRIPKAEEVKPRQIRINAGSDGTNSATSTEAS